MEPNPAALPPQWNVTSTSVSGSHGWSILFAARIQRRGKTVESKDGGSQ